MRESNVCSAISARSSGEACSAPVAGSESTAAANIVRDAANRNEGTDDEPRRAPAALLAYRALVSVSARRPSADAVSIVQFIQVW